MSALRRSSRSRQPPDFYGIRVNVASEIFDEPTSMTEALASPDKMKWTEAMETEMESLHKNEVCDLVKLPKDRRAVGSKWVFKLKVGPDGSVERHKARFWWLKGFHRNMVLITMKHFLWLSGLSHSEQ